MWGETKRMLFNKNFLAAWLIACISIAIGQTYPSLKKALACGTFISILEGSLKSQAVSFAIPVAAILPWSDSILQEYKSGFLKEILPRTTRRQYVEGKVFSIMMSGFMVWTSLHASRRSRHLKQGRPGCIRIPDFHRSLHLR